ncbi:MAG: NAD+ synthase [Phycisphaerae bacterium]|nr:NAD+ synthase [Phycisphaerae bacterium]
MKIALAQFNPIVGDISGNCRRMVDFIHRAVDTGAELVVFGELSVVGYPPRDLLRKDGFVAENLRAVEAIAAECTDIAALVGFVRPTPGDTGRGLQNAAALLAGGKIQHVHVKTLLPTYDVFDETRYFQPADETHCIRLGEMNLGVSICEDLWDSAALGRQLYENDPIARLAEIGSDVIINMAASPFESGKAAQRDELFRRQAARSNCPIVYVNQVGGNDELVFDGGSCVISSAGELQGRAKSFEEDLLVVDIAAEAPARCEPLGDEMPRLAAALRLGIGDYITKCGFSSVVLGLSGGIDSAVVAALAADALGGQNVHCLAMPSRYSSDHSLSDAKELADNLGCKYDIIPIESLHAAFDEVIGSRIAGGRAEIADENIQARIRGNIVMAWSNAWGHLPLATGNKSELAVGYCTLYGDMCGGLAPIGDVLKTKVYELAAYLNTESGNTRIPENILTKPPSAELKPNQTDQDKLPPYEVLDEILRRYVEQDQTAGEIVAGGFDEELTYQVVRMVDLAEYKRQQAARVIKVSARAFGMGRRVPIAQQFVQLRVNSGNL